MKNIIILISIIIIISGCATGYPKVEGELMRVYLANADARMPMFADGRTLHTKDCTIQFVPKGFWEPVVITKDRVLSIPSTKSEAAYLEKNQKSYPDYLKGKEDRLYTEKYQEVLEEGIDEYVCTDKKRTDKDIFHKTKKEMCPVLRESHYTKNDKEFLEVFKNEVLLKNYLEIPKKLGVKIYNKGLPTIQYTKELIELAEPAPNRGICLAMPLKSRPDLVEETEYTDILGHVFKQGGPSYASPGKFFKSYPTPKDRKNMLKDKDPNIYWEYPTWGGFFTPDGKVNKEKLKK